MDLQAPRGAAVAAEQRVELVRPTSRHGWLAGEETEKGMSRWHRRRRFASERRAATSEPPWRAGGETREVGSWDKEARKG